ncbi:MAG: hypothetical protein KAJ40_05225 [Alphaproteobacteria bacterium]|nr:hypothetical protein [Alphaproteobacteria bacterium]
MTNDIKNKFEDSTGKRGTKTDAIIRYMKENKNALLICAGAVVTGGAVAVFGFAKVLGITFAAGAGGVGIASLLDYHENKNTPSDDKDTPANE